MRLSQTLIPEFDQEMKNTRKVLERVPDDKLDWAPHEKSMTLGRLATHVAELAGLGRTVLQSDSFDIAEGARSGPPALGSRQEILDLFDKATAALRQALEEMQDEAFHSKWTLLKAGATIFSLPKIATLRTMYFNHIIHHRGQLTVYLRLAGAAVPSTYGPSADENPFG